MLRGAMHVHVRVYFRDAAKVVQPVVVFRGRTALRPREAHQQRGRKSCRQCESPGRPHTSCTSTPRRRDRKSTRLNSSHSQISYAVFCLKKKKTNRTPVFVSTA